jgi:mannose-6-phosphate isomerase-like protein (cupin superfamily)
MDLTPPPLSLEAARKLPWAPGRAAEVLIDGELEIRFTPKPTSGLQVPHQRDELYFVAAGTGSFRVADKVSQVGAGDLLFVAAHVPHGFEDLSDDFAIWIVFYGPVKDAPRVSR